MTYCKVLTGVRSIGGQPPPKFEFKLGDQLAKKILVAASKAEPIPPHPLSPATEKLRVAFCVVSSADLANHFLSWSSTGPTARADKLLSAGESAKLARESTRDLLGVVETLRQHLNIRYAEYVMPGRFLTPDVYTPTKKLLVEATRYAKGDRRRATSIGKAFGSVLLARNTVDAFNSNHIQLLGELYATEDK